MSFVLSMQVAQTAEPVGTPDFQKAAIYEFIAGVGAAAVTVPVTIALGSWLGSLSNNLIGAALPSLVLMLAVPPLVVTGIAYWAGNAVSPGAAKFHPAIWAALGVQALTLVAIVAMGVSSRDLGAIAAVTGAEMILLPGVVSGVMHVARPREQLQAYAKDFTAPVFAWGF